MEDSMLWVGLLIAMLVGFAKAGIPGTGILAVPLMAFLFDGKTSLGALLPMLMVADLIALLRYRKKAKWADIKAVGVWLGLGLLLGGAALYVIDAAIFKRVLGGILLLLLLLEFLRVKLRWDKIPHSKYFEVGFGILTGVSTIMGNAGGPVMTIFLLARGQQKFQFMGSMTWVFWGVNVLKFPFYCSMGLVSLESLKFNALLVPGIVVGAFVGIWLLPRINQFWFKLMVLCMVFLSALRLLIA